MSTRILSVLFVGASLGAALPASGQVFGIITHFPSPAAGSFSVVGANLPDGRLVIWNGDQVFIQTQAGSGLFGLVASGYSGDPGFITIAPDGQTALLGAGFSTNLYLLDTANPVDFIPGAELAGPTHFTGAYLTPTLVVLDRANDSFTGSELVVLDLSTAKSAPAVQFLLSKPPLPSGEKIVLDKPPFSFSSTVNIDPSGTTLYVMDANALELRTFSVADVLNAHNTATPLDWNTDGTLVGSVGVYFSSGVVGFRPGGELVIGGSLGFLQPGGIQIVNASTGAILQTLDPAGNQPFYAVIYNSVTDEIVARTGSGVVYATENGIASVPAASWLALVLLVAALSVVAVRLRNRVGKE